MQKMADRLAGIFSAQGFNMAAAELYKTPGKRGVADRLLDAQSLHEVINQL
jgi:hypothetical protein